MSLNEKIGQLFMTYFEGRDICVQAKRLVQELHVGGIIYYEWANHLSSFHQVRLLSGDLQSLAKESGHPPLWIAVDQEGGEVNRLKRGFTQFPSNAAIAKTGDPHLAFEVAKAMGKQLLASGINMNFAPVADINSCDENPVIGIRSFGEDPFLVEQFVRQSVRGFNEAGIICSLKHFPGHGGTQKDSHQVLPVIHQTLEEIWEGGLYPFSSLVSLAPAIMTAHVLFPKIDKSLCATLSRKIITGILREKMQYRGLVITDSLFMNGFLSNCSSLEEGVIQAFEAGNDLAVLGGRDLLKETEANSHIDLLERSIQALVQAVESGRIPMERIDQSLERNLLMKNLLATGEVFQDLSKEQKDESLNLSREIAYKSVKLLRGNLPLKSYEQVLIVAPVSCRRIILQIDWSFLGKQVYFHLIGSSDIYHDFEHQADLVILCSCDAWKDRKQLEELEKYLTDSDSVLIAMKGDRDQENFPSVDVVLATYNPLQESLQAAVDYLKARQEV